MMNKQTEQNEFVGEAGMRAALRMAIEALPELIGIAQNEYESPAKAYDNYPNMAYRYDYIKDIVYEGTKALNTCKAALEKPNMTYVQGFAHGYEAHRAETALENELFGNSEQLEQEPVAWFLQRKDSYEFSFSKPLITSEYLAVEPLYIGPTKSLSDDEVFALCPYKSGRQEDNSFCGEEEFYRGFRAAEKAHGIGE
jgi:hypothetical protein